MSQDCADQQDPQADDQVGLFRLVIFQLHMHGSSHCVCNVGGLASGMQHHAACAGAAAQI